jgi:hypothetical protein
MRHKEIPFVVNQRWKPSLNVVTWGAGGGRGMSPSLIISGTC